MIENVDIDNSETLRIIVYERKLDLFLNKHNNKKLIEDRRTLL